MQSFVLTMTGSQVARILIFPSGAPRCEEPPRVQYVTGGEGTVGIHATPTPTNRRV